MYFVFKEIVFQIFGFIFVTHEFSIYTELNEFSIYTELIMIMLYPNIKKVSKEVEKVFEQEVLVYSCVARGWYLIEKMLTDTVVKELILVVLVL